MAIFRKAVVATALIGAGLTSTTGMALATDGHNDNDTRQKGVANVDDTQANIPVNACNNNVPVNVLGVQVPLQDVAGNIPVGSPGENAGIVKDCGNGVDADN